MKISSIAIRKELNGLQKTGKIPLGNIVVLAGSNGSGKTRLLKLLEQTAGGLRKGTDSGDLELYIPGTGEGTEEERLTAETISKIELVNYSHYDAQLQPPAGYTPYVISKASALLQKYDYAETALNALLLLEDMANGYSEAYRDGAEWEKFVTEYAAPFRLELTKDENGCPKLFGMDTWKSGLSPGQQYLLRMAVACYRNERNENVVFLLDEPELHLHPEAQIELIQTLRKKFPDAQFWISTHSLALISFLTVFDHSTTILYLSKGEIRLPRSNSSDLLAGLIGSEDNRFAIRQLMAAPDEYACNFFAAQCMTDPEVFSALPRNPQNDLLERFFAQGKTIVDFGVGKCRLLEELSQQIGKSAVEQAQYYAYDKYDTYAAEAKRSMDTYGSSSKRYFNDKDALLEQIRGQADYVLMVNVFHEIDPTTWAEELAYVEKLLKEDGWLIIVEREELTVGEAPYANGFLVMTPNGARALFGGENCVYRPHPKKPQIVSHMIRREGLANSLKTVPDGVKTIHYDALAEIRKIKRTTADSDMERFKNGIRLAFYLNQYANSSLSYQELTGSSIPEEENIPQATSEGDKK